MKKIPRSDERWEKLLQQAGADAPPPVDEAALLRSVRQAAAESRPSASWAAEFYAVFGAAGVVRACLGGAGVLGALTAWQVWSVWQTLPWAQLALGRGGMP